MTSAPEQRYIFKEEPIDFKKYLNTVYRKRWVLISVISVIMIITLVKTLTESPKYRATAVLLVDMPASDLAPTITREGIKPSIGSDEYFRTQQNLIKTLMIAKRVKENLNLPVSDENLMNMITVEQMKKSRLINLSALNKDPLTAANIANAYAQAYIDQNVENMLFMSKEVLKALPGEERKKIENSTVYGQLKELNKEDAIDSLPSVYADPVIQRLKTEKLSIETELANLSKRYKEKHPKIISLKTRLSFTEDNIKAQKFRVVAMIKADLAGRLQINNIRIIDPAQVPPKPVSPNIPRDILSGLILSVFLGLGAIFFMESLDDSIKNKTDLEENIGLAHLGEFPLLKGEDLQMIKDCRKLSELDKKPEAAEAIRNIRTNVIFSMPKEKLKTILLTSVIPQEGKSFLAAYLAYSFAKNGVKTLLIDGDIRKPTVNQNFGIDRSPGLTNLLVEEIARGDAIKATNHENLFILPCGSKSPNPLELLGSDKAGALIREISKNFGKVIIDAPPSLVLSDALVLSKITDGVIFVVKSGFISKEVLKRVKEKFSATNSTVLGAVINFFEAREHSYYKDKYYHRYYKNYYNTNSTACSSPS